MIFKACADRMNSQRFLWNCQFAKSKDQIHFRDNTNLSRNAAWISIFKKIYFGLNFFHPWNSNFNIYEI